MRTHPLYKAKVGDFMAVALGGDDFGYVRIYRGSSLGVLPSITHGMVKNIRELHNTEPLWFFAYGAPDADRTEMIHLVNVPFEDIEQSWPPPSFTPPDEIDNCHRLFERGMMRKVVKSEVMGLKTHQTVTPESLREFILKNRKELRRLEGGGSLPASGDPNEEPNMPILLVVVFQDGDVPVIGRDKFEEPLQESLAEAGVGLVSGGGRSDDESHLDIEITNRKHVKKSLSIVKSVLRKLGCSKNTKIIQHSPKRIVHHI